MSVIKYKDFKIATVKTTTYGIEMYTSVVFLDGNIVAKRKSYSLRGSRSLAMVFVNSISA